MLICWSCTLVLGAEVRDSVLYLDGDVAPYAYCDRMDIREVRFERGSRVSKIGEYAFMGCANLREVVLPDSLKELGEGCFRETGVRSITLPQGVEKLPRYLFAWCGDLESIALPSGLDDIASHAFIYCGKLQSVTIPSGVKHIGSNAFSECRSLREVVLPADMQELESYAFSECVSLERAVMPSNHRLLGELIFSGCRSLRELTVMSPRPPKFDCDSYIFELDETALYSQCRLRVPSQSRAAYRRAAGWRLFKHIE